MNDRLVIPIKNNLQSLFLAQKMVKNSAISWGYDIIITNSQVLDVFMELLETKDSKEVEDFFGVGIIINNQLKENNVYFTRREDE